MKNKISTIIYFLLLVFLACLWICFLSLMLLLLIQSHEELVNMLLSYAGKMDKKEVFISNYLTIDKFNILRFASVILFAIYTLLGWKYFNKLKIWSEGIFQFILECNKIIQACYKTFFSLSAFQKTLVFVLFLSVLVIRLYYLAVFPLYNDEIFTWLYFVKPGFVAAISFYPGPNNHVLNSVCANVADLFFDNDKIVLRLFPLLAVLLTLKVGFFYFLKRYSFIVGFLFALFFSCFYNILYYSIMGRGYAFTYLFFLIMIISVLEILNRRKERFWGIVLVVSGTLGFYSIPVFLYPFASIFAFACLVSIYKKNYSLFYRFIGWGSLVVLFTFLLYSPILLVSGYKSLTGNSFVKPLGSSMFFSSLGNYFKTVLEYLWQSEFGLPIGLLILIISVYVLIQKKRYQFAVLSILCFLIPVVLIMVQRFQPFTRVWDYLLILFALLMAMIAEPILIFINRKLNYVISLSVLSVVSFYVLYHKTDSFVSRGFPFYTRLNTSMEALFQKDFSVANVSEETYFLFLQYYSFKKDKPVQVNWSQDPGADVLVYPANKTIPIEGYRVIDNNGDVIIAIKRDI